MESNVRKEKLRNSSVRPTSCFWILAFLWVLGVATTAQAQDEEEIQQPSPTPVGMVLKDKIGVGTNSIQLMINSSNRSFYIYDITTLSLRYWVSEQLALELSGSYSSSPNFGTDFLNAQIQDPNQTWGVGVGFKLNIKKPVQDLFVQFILRGSYAANNSRQSSYRHVDLNNNESWGAFTGLGFEYFLPFFNSLSVESSVGYAGTISNVNSSTHYNPIFSSYQDSSYARNYINGDIRVNGMTLTTLSVHFYF